MSNGWEAAFHPAPAFSGPIGAPPEVEGAGFRIKRACRTFDGAFFCGMEWDEWNLVRALVRAESQKETGDRRQIRPVPLVASTAHPPSACCGGHILSSQILQGKMQMKIPRGMAQL